MASMLLVLGGFALFILILRKTGNAKRRHDNQLGRDLEYKPLSVLPEFRPRTDEELKAYFRRGSY